MELLFYFFSKKMQKEEGKNDLEKSKNNIQDVLEIENSNNSNFSNKKENKEIIAMTIWNRFWYAIRQIEKIFAKNWITNNINISNKQISVNIEKREMETLEKRKHINR